MKRTYLSMTMLVALGGLTLLGQQPPSTPPQPQQGEVSTRLVGGSGGAPKLAIVPFIALSQDAETVAAAKTISEVLLADIAYEREFYMIGQDAIATVPRPTSVDDLAIDRWKELNADGVLLGTVRKEAAGVVVQVKMFQIATGKMTFGKQYSGSVANPRRYSHTIADEIHQMQQLMGVARTRLAFSSDRDGERAKGPVRRDIQEIYITDYDGANQRRITNTTTLNISPVWSPDTQIIAYGSWRPAGAYGTFQDIILSFITTGERQTPLAGNPQRQNYLPAFAPDGSKFAFTSNRDGNPEIYVANRDGSGLRRMTSNPGVDVTPTWSPTGNQLAWVSDRTGQPHIYIMNADGTGQRPLISEYCDRPTWSAAPFNEIAYAARTGPGYDIKVFSFSEGGSKKLTDGIGTNESPAFSPNGRHIAFTSTRNGKSQIFTIDRDGQNLRQITREGNNKYPNWSR